MRVYIFTLFISTSSYKFIPADLRVTGFLSFGRVL